MEKNLPKTFFHFLLRLYLSFARKFFYLVNFISGLPSYYSTPHSLLFPEKKYICLTNCTPLKVLHTKNDGPVFPPLFICLFSFKKPAEFISCGVLWDEKNFFVPFFGGETARCVSAPRLETDGSISLLGQAHRDTKGFFRGHFAFFLSKNKLDFGDNCPFLSFPPFFSWRWWETEGLAFSSLFPSSFFR